MRSRRVLRPDVRVADPVRSTAALTPGRAFVIGLPVVLVILCAVAMLVQRNLTLTLLAGTGLLLLLSGLGLLVSSLAHPRRGRVEVATERLWLPPVRQWHPLVVASLTLIIVFGAVTAVGAALDRDFAGPHVASVGAIVLSVACVRPLVANLTGRAVPPRVGLGRSELIRESGRGFQVVSWDDITAIDLVTDPAPRVLVTARTKVPTRYRSQPSAGERGGVGPRTEPNQIAIPTIQHGSDPRLVELLLRHYLRHPRHRAELGTPAAEERIARGDLTA